MEKIQFIIEMEIVKQVRAIGITEAVNLIVHADDSHKKTAANVTLAVVADFMSRIQRRIEI